MARLLAAFWITGIAVAKAALAFSADCSLMEALTVLMTFFTRVRLDLFRRFLTSFCLARFMTDLCVAKVSCSFQKRSKRSKNIQSDSICQELFVQQDVDAGPGEEMPKMPKMS
jgi:hypothetical protein